MENYEIGKIYERRSFPSDGLIDVARFEIVDSVKIELASPHFQDIKGEGRVGASV